MLFEKGDHWIEVVLIAIWAICTSRNRVIHEGLYQSAQSMNSFILGYAQELRSLPQENGQSSHM